MSRLGSLLSKLQPLEIPPHQLTLLTFALFPKLAPELRNMIWSQVACEPRTINIFRLDEDCASQSSNVEGQTRHPGILHACRESRKEALKHYEEHYRFCRNGLGHGEEKLSRNLIFINFHVDRFLLVVPQTTHLRAALDYAYPEGFNVGSEIIENIKHIGVEFRGSGSRKSRVTRLVLTRYLLLLHNEARLATIRLTFRDSILWYEADQSPLLLKSLRCLRTNEEYTRDISNGVRKDRDMPALDFFRETKDDEEWGNGSLMG
jgi:hypothetical protein